MFCNEFKATVGTRDPVGLTREQRERLTEHYRACPTCGTWFDLEIMSIPDEVADNYVPRPELVATKQADEEAKRREQDAGA